MKSIVILLCLACMPIYTAVAAGSDFEQDRHTKNSVSYGVVDFSVNFMRERPGYEEELGNQALMGTVVRILEKKGYWLKIQSPDPYVAWVNEMGIVPMDSLQVQDYIAAPKYICVSQWTNIYENPSDKSQRICDFVAGCLVRVAIDKRGRAEKSGKYLAVMLPSGKKGYVRSSDVNLFDDWAEKSSATPDNIVRTAMTFLGSPYMWGGTSTKGVDCSGLSRMVYFLNGVLLTRNASQQAKKGIEVDIKDIKPGDLLFFGKSATEDKPERVTHVGIYIGDNRFIHSSQVVRINSLNPTDEDYYGGNLLRVRRVCSEDGKPYNDIPILQSEHYFKVSNHPIQ